ncbi:MAG: AMP-binding protein [Deltaproteobacteria bacterium]|nr:AMP-binding protein [Deltaproteobacteria bacterium]
MGIYDFTFYDLIKRNAVTFGDKEAWYGVEDERSLTFSEYLEQVERLALGLREKDVKKGDRVGVLAKNSLEYFLLLGATAALGAILVPISWRLSKEEVRYNLENCKPVVVFVDDENQAVIGDLRENLPFVKSCFSLERTEGGQYPPFSSLMEKSGDFSPPDVGAEDGLVIIHTAAVAGKPRGALLSHANLLWADMHFDYLMNVTSKDVHLNFLPFFHVGGLFMTTAAFHAGALNVQMKGFDAVRAVDIVREKEASFTMVFTPILSSLLDEGEKKGVDISPLRAVTGIETPETIERYQKASEGTFYSMYGQTETSCLVSFGPYDERPGAAGRMLPMIDVRLVDEYDRPVARGEVGEITVKGPMVFKGYWGLPEETTHTFREGWHHTGDLGRFDDEGYLWYAGRSAEKELIKPGGENVYPAEVEKVILQHPAVEKTVVFGVPDPKWKEGIKAVCQLREGERLDAQELIDFVGERIARYKKPSYVEFVRELPLLKDGSIDRAEVKKRYGGEQ